MCGQRMQQQPVLLGDRTLQSFPNTGKGPHMEMLIKGGDFGAWFRCLACKSLGKGMGILTILILQLHKIRILTSLRTNLQEQHRYHTAPFRGQRRIYFLIILQFISNGPSKQKSKGVYNIDNIDYPSCKLLSAHHVTGNMMFQVPVWIYCHYMVTSDKRFVILRTIRSQIATLLHQRVRRLKHNTDRNEQVMSCTLTS